MLEAEEPTAESALETTLLVTPPRPELAALTTLPVTPWAMAGDAATAAKTRALVRCILYELVVIGARFDID